MRNFYHIYSKGADVICRSKSDYISLNNRLAVTSLDMNVNILAESIMSTHMHMVVTAKDEFHANEFTREINRNYAIYYQANHRQSIAGKIKFSVKSVLDQNNLNNVMVYVTNNPVHHAVTTTALEYPFCSGAYMFLEELTYGVFEGNFMNCFQKYGTLSTSMKRSISRNLKLLDDWLINADGMILPSSYIDIVGAKQFWSNNPRKFLFDINSKPIFHDSIICKDDLADLSWSGLNDIQACKIIDDYAQEKRYPNFSCLTDENLLHIIKKTCTQFTATGTDCPMPVDEARGSF